MIPDSFLMDGLRWTVHLTDAIEDQGETRPEQCEILISTRLDDRVKAVVFIHEVVHAIFATRGFDSMADGPSKVFTEEQVASILAPALYSFLRDNPPDMPITLIGEYDE